MGGSYWSDVELSLLRALYPTARWPKLLSAFPNRTKAAIRCQVISLGIKRERNSRTPWTGAERIRLAKLYRHAPWSEICAAIPRHPQQAIAKQANQLKLKRDPARNQSKFHIIRELRRRRQESGMRQDVLAKMIGAHRVQLARWETGEQHPRLLSMFDWVQALGFRLELVKAK